MSVSGNIEQSRQFLLLLFLQTTHPTALFISLLPSSRAELSLSPPHPLKVCSFLQNQPFIDFKLRRLSGLMAPSTCCTVFSVLSHEEKFPDFRFLRISWFLFLGHLLVADKSRWRES
ncbi:hypothetical protein GBA52_019593 [Prunus armeniaca]|nr:hypothetical protein GBA52_019593 [Prunus armeniaca]